MYFLLCVGGRSLRSKVMVKSRLTYVKSTALLIQMLKNWPQQMMPLTHCAKVLIMLILLQLHIIKHLLLLLLLCLPSNNHKTSAIIVDVVVTDRLGCSRPSVITSIVVELQNFGQNRKKARGHIKHSKSERDRHNGCSLYRYVSVRFDCD